ncbi:hypothetical protein EI555_012529 [Monodon monoceros]|uniref:Interleukin-3 n=1 Tax=Monodon monoceros TaxID=40151 RepID=A0A4V5P5P5_MONMO|nr:hypothetical protein EI555_012529 [Monodon monoceros]
MRSLPILHRLLFLLALPTPQAQGAPVKTPGTQQCYVLSLIREIINERDKLPVASEDFLNSNEKRRLMKTSLWRPNLEKFLTFATNSLGEDSKITKNLKEIQPILPTTMTTVSCPLDVPAGDGLSYDLTPACHPPSNLAPSNATFLVSSQEEPILIEKDNLGDFWLKLKEYLSAIRDSLNCKNTQSPNV